MELYRRKQQEIQDAKDLEQDDKFPKIAYVKDVKTSGTQGGNGAASTFHTRTLNTLIGGEDFVTLGNGTLGTDGTANQVTLAAGEYDIEAFSPSRGTDGTQLLWYNVTDSVYTIIGSSINNANDAYHNLSAVSLHGGFTITTPKVFELRLWTSTFNVTGTTTLGQPSNSGQVEVYSTVKITKLG